MYEARRQRSSWARIKLSIVRKVYLISVSLQSLTHYFFCCPFIIRFRINKFSSFLNIYILKNVSYYSVVNVQTLRSPHIRTLIRIRILPILAIYFRFQFRFLVRLVSCDYFLFQFPHSALVMGHKQTGGFLSVLLYIIASSIFVNRYFYISLHLWLSLTSFAYSRSYSLILYFGF